MNDVLHPALLPAGLYDLLPAEAQVEAEVTARLTGVLASHGYERVKPVAGSGMACAPAW